MQNLTAYQRNYFVNGFEIPFSRFTWCDLRQGDIVFWYMWFLCCTVPEAGQNASAWATRERRGKQGCDLNFLHPVTAGVPSFPSWRLLPLMHCFRGKIWRLLPKCVPISPGSHHHVKPRFSPGVIFSFLHPFISFLPGPFPHPPLSYREPWFFKINFL